jgi:inosine-uridine nucleoside N-ribohydrolase/formylmethanofuran dehydrogenase subunit E
MRMRIFGIGLAIVLLATTAIGHDVAGGLPVVIDTDLGLDDAVTLAAALQSPSLRIQSIVATPGVSSGDFAARHLGRMLDVFNRGDVPLYEPAPSTAQPAPPFRAFAEGVIADSLPDEAAVAARPFSPTAYAARGSRVVVLVLGPLTSLAAALEQQPTLRGRIREVVIAGPPDPADNWNLAYDQPAFERVRDSGVTLRFVVPTAAATKPAAWAKSPLRLGRGTSIGEQIVRRMLAPPNVQAHYAERLARFHDELALAYLLNAPAFTARDDGTVVPGADADVAAILTRALVEGRQAKPLVVLTSAILPDALLHDDVRQRKAKLLAAHGEAEFLAQVLMNEVHEHLGAYSIIGVKMGLRAAELLNAETHGMHVTTHVPLKPPVGCVNDGIIVATGCTPGRGLFEYAAGDSQAVAATFACNGRRVRLTLKPEYRGRVQRTISALVQKYGLEDPMYWAQVRVLGLDIWEQWSRADLFAIEHVSAD